MRGIVLAGGTGSRLWPITKVVSKQLLPIHNKPLVYYPISTLMLAGIREIMIITTPHDQQSFRELLGSGSEIGVQFKYIVQEKPEGLAQAFVLAEDFIGNGKVALILGDNIFHGAGLGSQLKNLTDINGCHVFAQQVHDPERYGVITFDDLGKPISIEEKPLNPKSKYAVPGLYFYDHSVVELAKTIEKSARGEFEISSLNQIYLGDGNLAASILPRGTVWLDTGTVNSLSDASLYVKVIEERQGSKIACLEEIAWRNNWISDLDLIKIANKYKSNDYGKYLSGLLA
jgi:glucose-1-phosphate thymidylyltransferase